jgi:hypothetical protein
MKRIVSIILLLSISAYSCSRIDLSTPEKCVESLYYAISKKDARLYSRCFYEGGEYNINEIKMGARYIFEHLSIVEYRIIGREENTADKVSLKVEEVSKKSDGLMIASSSVVTCIKVGKDWKILKSETVATKKIDKRP